MIPQSKSKLPEYAAVAHPIEGCSVLIKRGEDGYWPARHITDPDEYNAKMGVSKAQAQAMLAGSMFGWGIPAADPDTWVGKV